jgi:hypothetical protein
MQKNLLTAASGRAYRRLHVAIFFASTHEQTPG